MTARERLSNLQRRLREESLDFGIITSPENICYLTGYTAYPFGIGQNCIVVPTEGETTFIANNGEDRLASRLGLRTASYESFSIDIEVHSTQSLVKAISEVILGHNLRIGIEARHLSSSVRDMLTGAVRPNMLLDLTSTIMELRIRKDREELDGIRASIELAETGVLTMLEQAQIGASEIDVFSNVKARMEIKAGKPIDMYTDLISGEKCVEVGYPLAVASSKTMRDGEDVVCDVLVRMDGYYGDLTRTKHLGPRTAKQKDIYLTVKEAEKAAIRVVKPGVRACEVDTAARRVIEECGFELPHYTGHGLGLHYREEPILVTWNNLELLPGMVFTVEPGVYVRDEGSVRLEDNVLVTETGHEILSNLPYEL